MKNLSETEPPLITGHKISLYFIYHFTFFVEIGFKGLYLEDKFVGLFSSSGGLPILLLSWLTNSVMTLKPLESSSETTRGGGERPPSRDECLSRMVLVTSAKDWLDKTEREVGGRLVPTPIPPLLPSLDEAEDIEPLELGRER